MGKLINSIIDKEQNGQDPQIIIDFEQAKPTEEEKQIHEEVAKVLNKVPQILDKLFRYDGCEEFIRKAITTPGPETEEAAWNAVLPAVDQLQEFYDYSLELEGVFPKLLVALCPKNPKIRLLVNKLLQNNLLMFLILYFDLMMQKWLIQQFKMIFLIIVVLSIV